MKYAMADGREFTSYEPSCSLYNFLRNKYAPKMTPQNFRIYLQRNAEKLQKDFADCAKQPNCKFCPVCKAAMDYKPPSTI